MEKQDCACGGMLRSSKNLQDISKRNQVENNHIPFGSFSSITQDPTTRISNPTTQKGGFSPAKCYLKTLVIIYQTSKSWTLSSDLQSSSPFSVILWAYQKSLGSKKRRLNFWASLIFRNC
jgi:hypothetical protein